MNFQESSWLSCIGNYFVWSSSLGLSNWLSCPNLWKANSIASCFVFHVSYWRSHFSLIPHEQIWGQGHGERSQNECKDLRSLREVSWMFVKSCLSLPKSNHLQLSWLEILKGPDEMKFWSLRFFHLDIVGTCAARHSKYPAPRHPLTIEVMTQAGQLKTCSEPWKFWIREVVFFFAQNNSLC